MRKTAKPTFQFIYNQTTNKPGIEISPRYRIDEIRLTYGGLEEYRYSIQEVKVPNSGQESKSECSRKESHKPLVNVLFRLNILHFKVFAQVWQIVLEHLLEELENLFNQGLVKSVERHDRELCYHVAECNKGRMFVHV